MRSIILFLSGLLYINNACSQETLCSNGPARAWWDVQQYNLSITFDTASADINGVNIIDARVVIPPADALQIDLNTPLRLDSVVYKGQQLSFNREGNAFFVKGAFSSLLTGDTFQLAVYYSGSPVEADRAPWGSGFVRTKDSNGNPWLAVACQGDGGSVWFPCKNFQGDEPEKVITRFTVPASLSAIGNGRLQDNVLSADSRTRTWTWMVENPINNYDITFYIGDYIHLKDSMDGAGGRLTIDYYVLRENQEKALKQFSVTRPMLSCFEEKIGPYPFYKDGYKLVDAPYLGMEHQSAIAYGNGYQMGYRNRDRSGTGVGLMFDFIIIHESGHEWYGNSITAYDKADTWIHEGFTTYTETIFAECLLGKEKAFEYQHGKRQILRNDRPAQGAYNQCDEGSGDHYDKAAFMIHMIRVIMNDDTRFFAMLREMSRKYYHSIVTGKEIEGFINTYSGKDFSTVFDQYLRSAAIPVLEIKKVKKGRLSYRWSGSVPGFNMQVVIKAGNKAITLYPTGQWNNLKLADDPASISVSEDFLVDFHK
jgi:aminopeptidase N